MVQAERIARILWILQLLHIGIMDWKTRKIRDRSLVFLFLLEMLLALVESPGLSVGNRIAGSFVVSMAVALLTVFLGAGFGGGDVKLMAVAGFTLGVGRSVSAFVFSLLLAAVGLAVRALRFQERTNEIAFGPYLSAGIVLAFFYGEQFLAWYVG